jgi:hypothetical protein
VERGVRWQSGVRDEVRRSEVPRHVGAKRQNALPVRCAARRDPRSAAQPGAQNAVAARLCGEERRLPDAEPARPHEARAVLRAIVVVAPPHQ